MSNGEDEQDVKSNGGDLALNINIVKGIERKNGTDDVERSPWTLKRLIPHCNFFIDVKPINYNFKLFLAYMIFLITRSVMFFRPVNDRWL